MNYTAKPFTEFDIPFNPKLVYELSNLQCVQMGGTEYVVQEGTGRAQQQTMHSRECYAAL